MQIRIKEISNIYLQALNDLIKKYSNNNNNMFNYHVQRLNQLHNLEPKEDCVYNTDKGNFLNIPYYIAETMSYKNKYNNPSISNDIYDREYFNYYNCN